MTALLLIFLLGFCVYALFISRSIKLGKFLYFLAMKLEQKIAGLTKHVVLIDSIPISYYQNKKSEQKPVLLLLHGFSADKKIWHRFALQAKNDYQLIIPDLLGHGDTPYSSTQNYSTNKQSTMLIKLLDALNIKTYYVIGNSMGGMIAMKLILQDPTRALKAVLLDPAGAKTDFVQSRMQTGENPFLLDDIQAFFAFYDISMSKPPFTPPSVLHYIGQNYYLNRQNELAHMSEDFFKPEDMFEQSFDVDPTKLRVIWGEQDKLLPLSEADKWRELTQSEPLVYPGIGHMPMVEAVKKCYVDCHQFLSKVN